MRFCGGREIRTHDQELKSFRRRHMSSVGQYGPRGRLLLCRGASGSADQVTQDKVPEGCLEHIVGSISCLLTRRVPSERRGEIILIQEGDNACQA